MLTLGIETSCDETAAAVLKDTAILSNIVSSQTPVHEKYGGVVPELASREHLRNLLPVVRTALRNASATIDDIGLVAVTSAPGLIGALLVGVSAAKAIAFSRHIPFIGVHHGEAHILSPLLEHPDLAFPYLALLASGGHTALYLVRDIGNYRMLGQTRDDAAGEAYDKVAKLLGLPYPGGPVIDRLAREGDPGAVHFPRGRRDGCDFSFSGLKTAVRSHVALFRQKDAGLDQALNVPDIAASFQAAVVDTLVDRTLAAVLDTGVRTVVVAGGVAANSELRARMQAAADEHSLSLHLPARQYCSDNAAMVALAGLLRYKRNGASPMDLNPSATMAL